MNIPEGTILAHAKRHGWTKQIQIATQQQSDAITPVQSVPQSIASILNERKDRTKLGLSKYAAEAAEQAAEHRDKLGLPEKWKTWQMSIKRSGLINLGVLIGTIRPEKIMQIEGKEVAE
jgi:hypothetical protein